MTIKYFDLFKSINQNTSKFTTIIKKIISVINKKQK
ncbi:hypothetical protein m4_igs_613 [Acanthamoeba polyphaga mimivirus]|nr:hypothetical protein m4_igs_613 [Acanthamoeba polyphaga mimivirus]